MPPEVAFFEVLSLDVRGMGRLVASALAGLERLWRTGALSPLIETRDGRRAMEIFETVRASVTAQWAEAVAQGHEHFDLRLSLPRPDLDLVIPFTRQLFDLLTDPAAMERAGGVPIGEPEVRLFEQIVKAAELSMTLSASKAVADEAQQVTIEWPPIEVRRMGEVIARGVTGFELLWGKGRLQPLLRSPEGREALGLLEAVRASVIGQWADAVAREADKFTLRITVPRDTALIVIGLARKLIGMLTDTQTMKAAGGVPLEQDDARVLEEITLHAEGMLAAGDA